MSLLCTWFAVALLHGQVVAAADFPADYVGSWRLDVPQELSELNRKIGLPDHSVRIDVVKDARFDFVWTVGATSLKASGRCEVRDGKLHLLAQEKLPVLGVDSLVAELADGRLKINGGTYHKVVVIDLTGVWTLRSNGKEDNSISVKFTAEGRFSFTMANAKSMGSYEVEGTKIKLTYENVDGQKLETPFVKNLDVSEDGLTITVDGRFTYQRKGT